MQILTGLLLEVLAPLQPGDPSNTSPNNVDANTDASNRIAAINNELAGELNDITNGVGGKLEDAWPADWRNLWTQEPFKIPVIILTVVGGILGILLIMGVMIIFKIDEVTPFFIIGISLSGLTLISILSCLLFSNIEDKTILKSIGISLEYYNFQNIYKSKDNSQTVQGATQNTGGNNPGGSKKIDASKVSANNHFQTSGGNAPQIRVTLILLLKQS